MKKPLAKQIILGTLALTLIGGGGYLIKGQDALAATTSTTTTDAATAVTPKPDNHAYNMVRKVNDELIAFLKLDKATFQEKITSGKTLAEIATEQGISRDALKAELTKEVAASLEKEKADFAANLDTTIDTVRPEGKDGSGHGSGPRGPGDRGGFGGPGGHARTDLTSVATALGYATLADLKEALTADVSIADLAATKSVAVQKLIDLQVIEITKILDAGLASGKLTQAQYDAQKANATVKATEIINDTHTGKGPDGRGGKGGPGGRNHAAAAGQIPSASTTPTVAPAATTAT